MKEVDVIANFLLPLVRPFVFPTLLLRRHSNNNFVDSPPSLLARVVLPTNSEEKYLATDLLLLLLPGWQMVFVHTSFVFLFRSNKCVLFLVRSNQSCLVP